MIEINLLTPPGNREMTTDFTDQATLQDLGIEALIDAMAAGDPSIGSVALQCFLHAPVDPSVIRWRQEVLRDSLNHPELIRDLKVIAHHGAALERRSSYALRPQPPISLLLRSRELLGLLIPDLRALAHRFAELDSNFTSEGLELLATAINEHFGDDDLDKLDVAIRELRFEHGLIAWASLGAGNLTSSRLLLQGPIGSRGWRDRLHLTLGDRNRIEIAPRDQAGGDALRGLRNQALAEIGSVAARGLRTIIEFFVELNRQLAWLVGAINLHDRLKALGLPLCFPSPTLSQGQLAFQSLVEPTLALRTHLRPVSNDLGTSTRAPIVISGANSGGKTTWLQGVALAMLMMQAGLFVTAEAFNADARTHLYTFFPRDEDRDLQRGRLDDELTRLSTTISALSPEGLLFLNEPLSTTNEIEACAIMSALVDNLTRRDVTTFVVTHYPTLARALATNGTSLRPETAADGARTYRIEPSAPPEDSSAMDVYSRLGGW
ncbi:hypothetical protein [Ferrimicrobium sp.]|uniref:MutS-related protein n=1 Tax=Ferrimicrobium sp. TaxID=2926050 RepID=UPI0026024DF1|nr:hypothetical protein [Ferrimicrobium sp.]